MRQFLMSLLMPLALAAALVPQANASVQYSLDDEQQIARLHDLTLSRQLLDIFLSKQKKAAAASGKQPTLQLILQQLLDDALMAEHARSLMTADELAPASRVGFAPEVERHNQLVSLLRGYFNDAILASVQQLPGQNFSSLVQWNSALDAAWLNQNFALKPGLTIDMTDEQRTLAAQTPVLSTELADGGNVTLLDIMQRQNVQGRLALLSGNLEYLQDQTRQYVGGLYVLHWSRQQLGAADWQTLQQILVNQQQRQRLLEHMGIYADIHDDNPALRARAGAIPQARLNKAWEHHKDDFRVVEKVRARHVQVATQELADQVVAELKNGLSFEDAISRYSQAADKQSGGALGWLKRGEQDHAWLHSVAFIQPIGKPSAAFRSPEINGVVVYEILHIDERIEGYLPVTDAGVRYELAHELAREDLQQELKDLQVALREKAAIQLNRRLQPAAAGI
ncbi:peptidylprolyl isomerase [Thalassolituus sp. LLYu03]|uniref:peptidylprolyl isomerase n=1 Tax=Thalassolituus sp. LLYu03 TaxID=3421656 RepID=UPI003D2770F8